MGTRKKKEGSFLCKRENAKRQRVNNETGDWETIKLICLQPQKNVAAKQILI